MVAQAPRRKIGEVRSEALAALARPVPRRKPPLSYRASLMLVSVVVVALPLVYVALVAALGWGVFWYGRNGAELMSDVDNGRAYALGRFGPLVVGAVLFFFLLKPLLARRVREAAPHVLRPEDEPFLFDFVRALASALGAPMPRRIVVDLEVNASAGFARGWTSLVDGSLALTLGLPLVSSFRLRELTAVLAHEFGHLSQGAGMRFYYVTASVNRWFARVVFERDRWDARLEAWSRSDLWMLAIVFRFAAGGVWLSRKILLGLLKVASAASSLMSRQMEFDADRNAVALCGAASFARSMELLPQIEVATQWASKSASASMREGVLPDDWPYLIAHGLAQLTPEASEQIVAHAAEGTVDMYATHPSTGQRIRRANAIGGAGVFAVDAPARVLFRDYPELCRALTRASYENAIDGFDPACLQPSARVVAAGDELQSNAERAHEYFLGHPIGPATLALEPPTPAPPADPRATIAALAKARDDLRAAVPLVAEPETSGAKLARLVAVRDLRAARLRVTDGDHKNLMQADAEQAVRAELAAFEAERALLAPFAEAARARIAATLDLLCVPAVAERIDDAPALLERARRAAAFLAAARSLSERVHELRREMDALAAMSPQLEGQDPAAVDRVLGIRAISLHGILVALREEASGLRHPFLRGLEGREGEAPLDRYLVPTLHDEKRWLQAQAGAAHGALEAYQRLLLTALGAIAAAGTAVERALSLTPLEPAV